MERITEYTTDDYAGRPAIYDEATINAIANKEKVDIVCFPVTIGVGIVRRRVAGCGVVDH